ncbi:MAG: multidrug effflux MFS transporter [Geminicoccales bacterium]
MALQERELPITKQTPSEPDASNRQGAFPLLMALLMSLVALSIDMMLPALSVIGQELGVEHENEAQLVLSALFLGLAFGQMIYGPLSDRFGRKPLIQAGLLLFMLGSLLSILAGSFSLMLIGRMLQGFGIAGPRIVSVAMVRDRYSGDAMARVTSLIMTIFILVPLVAPALGQGLMLLGHWRLIFIALLAVALAASAWLHFLQPETLARDRRLPLSFKVIYGAAVETVSHPVALGYTVAAGLIFGAFLGYLNSAAQILQIQYGLGLLFPLYFSGLAFAFGAATLLNARLVMRLGMKSLARTAIIGLTVTSVLYLGVTLALGGHPPLWSLMIYLVLTFFAIGMLFGNFNALAMEPLGHIAGVAAGMIGTLTTFMSVLLGGFIGSIYDGTIIPITGGFAVLGLLSLIAMLLAERSRPH